MENNKALELFNSSDSDIYLSNYSILGNYNGNSFDDTFTFPNGTLIKSLDTYVIVHEEADLAIKSVADTLVQDPSNGGDSYVVAFNGDDTRALIYNAGNQSITVDIIGAELEDPGSGWDVAGVSAATKDHTLVRKPIIKLGNNFPLNSFGSDSSSSEWVVYNKDDFSHIGSHTHGSDSSDVPNSTDFYLHENGITIICNEASIGDKGIVAGTVYTKRSADQITVDNASTTCTSDIRDMNEMFYMVGNKLPIEITHWDVSSVENMSKMFAADLSSNYFESRVDLNHWDISSVTNMSRMFYGVRNIPLISDWDVSNVVDMSGMFSTPDLAYETIGSDITNWDVSNVTNMNRMFAYRLKFNQDISGWNVSRVKSMGSMFKYNEIFNQDISGWDVDSVTTMSSMFIYADIFNQDLSGWNVSRVTNMSGMFANTTDFNQYIGGWDVSSVNKMGGMFSNALSFNQDISSWDVSNVYSWEMDEMFDGALQFNQDLSGWCVSQFEFAPSRFGNFGKDPVWGTCKPKIIRIAPQDSQMNVGLTPTFIWRSDSLYNYYHFEWMNSGLGDTLIHNDTSYTLPYPLEPNSIYSWRIRGYKETYDQQNGYTGEYGPNNKFWSFQTDSIDIDMTILKIKNLKFLDEDSLNVVNHNPIFSYNYMSGDSLTQKSYQFQVTTNNLFETITHWDSGFIETDSTIFSYSGDSLVDGSTYYSRLRITTDSDTSSWKEFTFRMNSTPDIPTLSSPSNNFFFKLDDEISLQVDKVTDAEEDSIQYYFELYNETNDIIETESGLIPSPSWTVTNFSSKEENMSYSWLVRSYDGFEYSTYSDRGYFYFNEVNEQPNLFRLLNSKPDSSNNLNYEFSWEKTTDPDPLDTVEYILSIGSEISNLKTYEVGSDTTYTLEGLEDNTTYYWKVVAKDTKGATRDNTGGYISFQVNTSNDAPSVAELISPSNNSVEIVTLPKFAWRKSTDPDNDSLRLCNYVFRGFHIY